jgi:hypothetical protein
MAKIEVKLTAENGAEYTISYERPMDDVPADDMRAAVDNDMIDISWQLEHGGVEDPSPFAISVDGETI